MNIIEQLEPEFWFALDQPHDVVGSGATAIEDEIRVVLGDDQAAFFFAFQAGFVDQLAGGTWLGFPILDPIIGILIGIAILFITRDATISMWYRLMDAIEPELLVSLNAP